MQAPYTQVSPSDSRGYRARPWIRIRIIKPVHVIGGGLAGSEAAWQIAQAGVPVILHEMRRDDASSGKSPPTRTRPTA
jgi:heterodisulfide reductase subunit A-like polyferredoxin